MNAPASFSGTLIGPSQLRDLVPAAQNWSWLDTPAAPPALGPVLESLRTALDDWEAGTFDWQQWEDDARATRGLLADLLGRQADDVAVVGSAAEAVATVASTLPPGEILVGDAEFRSVLFPWLRYADERHSVRRMNVTAKGTTGGQLASQISERTTLVAVSELLSSNGSRLDLTGIARRCREVGARLLVDVTQSLGVLRSAVRELPADYVVVHGYKWLMAPRGAAWFYVAPERQGELKPLMPSWRSVDEVYGAYFGGELTLSASASRFDCSYSWLPFIGARRALEVACAVDIESVEEHVLGLARRFRDAVGGLGLQALPFDLPSQVVVVETGNRPGLATALARRRVRALVSNGRMRVGFHGFNTTDDVDAAIEALAEQEGRQ